MAHSQARRNGAQRTRKETQRQHGKVKSLEEIANELTPSNPSSRNR
ncbi:DUF6254 family protein [Fictibacillus macauensis]|nr:DUF6254 family protein [Fictibacillus macauensis]